MKFSKEDILGFLGEKEVDEDVLLAREFLMSPDTECNDPVIGGKPVSEMTARVKDQIRIWGARYQNSLRKDFKLPGIADFVSQLHSLPENSEVWSLTFKRDQRLAKFFFEKDSLTFIGFVISIDRQTMSPRNR